MIVLASQSASRRALLSAAQIPFEAMAPGVDEEAAKEALRGDGLDARALADALAELKALKVSRRVPGALVLGCDQTLSLDDGQDRGAMIDKAVDRADAVRILRTLSGRVHHLHSAAVIVLNGEPIWRHVERVQMSVRSLSDAFIESYLDADWDELRWCVGCYRIEGRACNCSARSKAASSRFRVAAVPLLDFLRVRGVLAA